MPSAGSTYKKRLSSIESDIRHSRIEQALRTGVLLQRMAAVRNAGKQSRPVKKITLSGAKNLSQSGWQEA
jgi:hypothetical protein